MGSIPIRATNPVAKLPMISPAAASAHSVRIFQIIFNPTSAAELTRMPKELQLQILG